MQHISHYYDHLSHAHSVLSRRLRVDVSYSETGMNVPTFSRFRILLRLCRPLEPSSRPPGRPSPGEVEAEGHGSAIRSKRNDPPRVDKRASECGEHAESQSCDETILGILHIPIYI